MKHTTPPATAMALIALAVGATTITACGDDDTASDSDASISELLDEVRGATAKYHDVDDAVADGYQAPEECVPNMGYHYSKEVGDDSELDPLEPQLLNYVPDADGNMRLVAVEYATTADDAELFGVAFDPPGDPGPPFSSLHAWIWQGNPDGTFAPLNPLVECD